MTLPRLTWLQRISLVLLAVILVNRLIAATTGVTPLSGIPRALVGVVFLFTLFAGFVPPLMRRITWRVRNRLIVTYFLVGVLPILLIVLFVEMGFLLVLGQMTNYLLHQELDRRIDAIYEAGERKVGGDAEFIPAPSWSMPGFKGIVRDGQGRYFLAANASGTFAIRPMDDALLAELLPGMGSVSVIEGETVHFRIGTRQEASNAKIPLDSADVAEAPPSRGWWDTTLESGSPLEFRSLETGAEDAGAFIVSTHPSAILSHVFSALGQTAGVLGLFMAAIAVTFLVVEILAVITCVRLARGLTRTVHDLDTGTKTVEGGDFSHRIPVRANDQLSALASSFNGMTKRIEQLIVEVKEKEKLESELEIARQVQAQLFPKEVPKLATLELAGVCNPARVVSGDYYDFIPLDSRGAAVVIGDISGKGISAALLMAALQSSLHAQLSMGNAADIQTSTLVTRLNRQLYDNTPPEKYATFYCAVYDDNSSRLSYTNAGHLAPILIRNGEISRLESNGTVVGIFPEYPFEQCDVSLQQGDLLAAFTDGITESENAQEEQFGEDRLIELLKQNSGKPLNEIIQSVMNAVSNWAYDPSMRDDITMLLARKL